MPRIPASITNSIVYLYETKAKADNCADFGASGFMLGIPSGAGIDHVVHVYVVSNKHVIDDVKSYPVVRANLRHASSEFERVTIFEFKACDWVLDAGNDLAVCPLPPEFNLEILAFYPFLPRQLVMTREEFQQKDVGPGDEVVYAGRFVGHAGRYENVPSVRFGNISMNPNEREPVVWETPARHYEQVGFLVEARSRSGYSGSPVFFLHQHAVNNRRAVWPALDMRLLGVDWGHLPERVAIKDKFGISHGEIDVHAGMMGVVPAWTLLDFIDNHPDLVEQRRRDDEFYMRRFGGPANGVPF